MARNNSKNTQATHSTTSSDSIATVQNIKTDTVEVLYQKMGDRWFAFSLIDDEVFVGSLSQEEINSGNHEPNA